MPVKNIIPGQPVTKEKLQRAKELRREMTPAEKILWEELRAHQLGVHFWNDEIFKTLPRMVENIKARLN